MLLKKGKNNSGIFMEEIEKRNLVVKASMRAGISIGGFLILRFFVSSYSGDFPLVGFLSMLLFFLTPHHQCKNETLFLRNKGEYLVTSKFMFNFIHTKTDTTRD